MILCADDDAISRRLISFILTKNHMTHFIVEDGLQLIDASIAVDFDLILTDVNMPNMDGIEAAKIIKSKRNVPIIAVSCIERPDPIFDIMLQKPITERSIIEAIGVFLA
jgi:CheY-like chemotaxis protein